MERALPYAGSLPNACNIQSGARNSCKFPTWVAWTQATEPALAAPTPVFALAGSWTLSGIARTPAEHLDVECGCLKWCGTNISSPGASVKQQSGPVRGQGGSRTADELTCEAEGNIKRKTLFLFWSTTEHLFLELLRKQSKDWFGMGKIKRFVLAIVKLYDGSGKNTNLMKSNTRHVMGEILCYWRFCCSEELY